jgi:DMSO/TMAO reductase YedYZ molybdopterin-dependent catalytic subunit
MADDPVEPARRKLVETKERWAREGRLLTGTTAKAPERRLPPGQQLVRNWPILDLGTHPNVPAKEWQLTVAGLVEHPIRWSWSDLERQPVFRATSDIHCVTQWSRFDNRWEGVSARHLIETVKPKPAARFVMFKSYDGYQTNLPLAAFDDDDVLLATHWEGKPLAREHGGPVRVVVPKLYFWKSAKWVRNILFAEKETRGFWEVRGYHNFGDPWREQRYG